MLNFDETFKLNFLHFLKNADEPLWLLYDRIFLSENFHFFFFGGKIFRIFEYLIL